MPKTVLLSIGEDAKTRKGEKDGVLTGILYLAPSNESGAINVCAHASVGCRAACLYTAGMGRFPAVKKRRIARTLFFKNDRARFMVQLAKDIVTLEKTAASLGMIPAVRLNGTSDLPWENLDIIEQFPHIQFYDYTKNAARLMPNSKASTLKNYHLTFSRSEDNGATAELLSSMGRNVAVVFSSAELPAVYLGRKVVNGDVNDLRFRDPSPCVVGLKAKGRAKYDASGFVVQVEKGVY